MQVENIALKDEVRGLKETINKLKSAARASVMPSAAGPVRSGSFSASAAASRQSSLPSYAYSVTEVSKQKENVNEN